MNLLLLIINIIILNISPVETKDDINFEILNIDSKDNSKQITLGSVRFSLNLIERQDEYDVLLEVPDINDETDIYAKINAKIQFIWSLHKFYSDELVKSEDNFNKIKTLISAKQQVLSNLNGR